MTFRDRRRYEMLVRVRNFGATHGQLFPTTSSAPEAFAAVAAEIEQLEALDVAERAASESARSERRDAARKALSDYLTRAGKTALVLARTTPQLAARVELPDPMDDVSLLTIARQFAARVPPYAAAFTAHGITADALEGHIEAFEAALNERGMSREARVQARARIQASLDRALHAVATLDVIVANHLAGDAAAVAVWKTDRKIQYARRSRNGAAAEPAPEPAAPAAAA